MSDLGRAAFSLLLGHNVDVSDWERLNRQGTGKLTVAPYPEAKPAEPAPESPFDTQVGGDHYSKLKIQPFQYSFANGLGPAEHTVVKYVTRWRDKGGLKDLEKAKHVIDLLIAFEKEQQSVGKD